MLGAELDNNTSSTTAAAAAIISCCSSGVVILAGTMAGSNSSIVKGPTPVTLVTVTILKNKSNKTIKSQMDFSASTIHQFWELDCEVKSAWPTPVEGLSLTDPVPEAPTPDAADGGDKIAWLKAWLMMRPCCNLKFLSAC